VQHGHTTGFAAAEFSSAAHAPDFGATAWKRRRWREAKGRDVGRWSSSVHAVIIVVYAARRGREGRRTETAELEWKQGDPGVHSGGEWVLVFTLQFSPSSFYY
jgi:hypothetical protein